MFSCISLSNGLENSKNPGLTLQHTPVSLYIHVPLCSRKCRYCDFYSVPYKDELGPKLIRQIIAQLSEFDAEFHPQQYTTIYIGGGTPNILPTRAFRSLLGGIYQYSGDRSKEWTVELNPEYVSPQNIDLLSEFPVTRISIGIQSFNESLLKTLGRNSTKEKNIRAMKIIQERWKGELNLDLLCAIPGQTENDLYRDIRQTIDYAPDHVSLYTLTVEGGTPMADLVADGSVILPPEEEQLKIWTDGMKMLESAGYYRYEISNYARLGKKCQHNIRYWEMEPYLGCGPGAVSTLKIGDTAVRLHVEETLKNDPVVKHEIVSRNDFMLEYIMMGLRLRRGIGKVRFKDIWKTAFTEIFADEMPRWKQNGLIEENEEYVYATIEGMYVLDTIILEAALAIEKKL